MPRGRKIHPTTRTVHGSKRALGSLASSPTTWRLQWSHRARGDGSASSLSLPRCRRRWLPPLSDAIPPLSNAATSLACCYRLAGSTRASGRRRKNQEQDHNVTLAVEEEAGRQEAAAKQVTNDILDTYGWKEEEIRVEHHASNEEKNWE
ncbi:hypothetical protein E2562_032843 [Oryza meyeriana var. granulata]|uniref:Uncharacterized protein n=1 Tax=Oryza meyeriana var. granulata TaxID=110450 RepID=A0A6G1DRT8_9ORYZ|nr:hypothetical protein E2562_032843 [Oryza meyeriana var. granulata]